MDILNICVLLHLAFFLSRPATISMLDLFLLFYTTWAISLREHSFGTKSRYRIYSHHFSSIFGRGFGSCVLARSRAFNKDEKQAVKSKGEKRKSPRMLLYCSHTTHVVHLCARDIPLVALRIEIFTKADDAVFFAIVM
jgi:hypothetical protein